MTTSLMVALAVGLAASGASAQVELTGDHVRYVAIDVDGTMVCESCGTGNHSMQYREAAADTPTCDLYHPGSPWESFTVEGTAGGVTMLLTNYGDPTGGPDAFTTTSLPALSGRSITWAGTGSIGTASLRLDQTVSYEIDDRVVQLSVTITNTGTTAVTDLYYLRNGDPDHGQCNIGGDYATNNDVRRQPPLDVGALATSRGGDASSPGRSVVLGVGSFDSRARVHTGGFGNIDASGEWMSPSDSDGALRDEAVDIVFHVASLAGGAATTFEILYVWGRTVADVEARFDALGFPTAPCDGLAEGAACTTGTGATGRCRTGRCCTGCWNGLACQSGNTSAGCGAGGAACASCADAMPCTLDVCTAGACSNPRAPEGSDCDDGMFCTLGDACDASGRCAAGAAPRCDDGLSCTTDSCDEPLDRCAATLAEGCAIDGACVEEGAENPGSPCLVCDSSLSTSEWSPRPEDSECGPPVCSAGTLRVSTCDEEGRCAPRMAVPCPTGACASSSACRVPCGSADCDADEYCDESTMRCEPRLPDGARCSEATVCASGACADGFCCNTSCDGLCAACDLATTEGECTMVPAGSDPDEECASACDGAGACLGLEDAGSPDAGADAGPAGGDAGRDAGTRADAGGATVIEDDGCGCASGTRPTPVVALFLVALVLAGRRSRSMARRKPSRTPRANTLK